MDYNYLSSIVSDYSNLTTLNSLGGGVLGGNSAIKGISALTNLGSMLESLTGSGELTGADTFSTILDAAMKTGAADGSGNMEDTLEVLKTATDRIADDSSSDDFSEELTQKLSGIAGAGTDSAFEGEARSNMILQNYLYTVMMKDSLNNSLTEKGDFTSGIFSDLAVGSEDSDGSSILGSLKDTTLGAIGNYSSYKTLVENTLGSDLDSKSSVSKALNNSSSKSLSEASAEMLGSLLGSTGAITRSNVLGNDRISASSARGSSRTTASSALGGTDTITTNTLFANNLNNSSSTNSTDSVTAYSEQGSLLREMLSSLSNELRNIPASEETQEPYRNYDSHLRLRSAAYHQA